MQKEKMRKYDDGIDLTHAWIIPAVCALLYERR